MQIVYAKSLHNETTKPKGSPAETDQNSSRTAGLVTLPMAFRGKQSTVYNPLGNLYCDSLSRHHSRSDSCSNCCPDSATIATATDSPQVESSTPTTVHSAIAGCCSSTDSIFNAESF